MKRVLIFTVLFCVIGSECQACDACGCSPGAMGQGILTAYKKSIVGLNYQQSAFRSHPEHGNSQDMFHLVELWTRVRVTQRLNLALFVPYELNVRKSVGVEQRIQGLGDIRVMASYAFLSEQNLGSRSTIYAEAGLGLKLPSGKFNEDIHDLDIPENFNLGHGNASMVFQPAAVVKRGEFGLAMDAMIQYELHSSDHYRFGHQLSTQVLCYYEKTISPRIMAIPYLGVQAEYVAEDAYAHGLTVPGTGGKGLYGSAGLNVKLDQFLAGFSYTLPLAQYYASGEVTARNRLACQIAFIF